MLAIVVLNMIKKIKKKNTQKLLYFGISILIVVISIFGVVFYSTKAKGNIKPISYNDLIIKEIDKNNDYVSLEITDLPYQIAETTVNYSYIKYYILRDENNYLYVAKLSDKTYKKIESEYKKNNGKFLYNLTGYIYKTPDDLKNIIMDTYNENSTNTKITEDNFSNYFGSTYLDDTYTKYTTQYALCEIIAIISGALSIFWFIEYVVSIINTKKTLSNINLTFLENEFSKSNTKEYKKEEIYITDKYLISTYKGLQVFDYDDIAWLYLGYSFSKILFYEQLYINIFTKNKRKYKTKKVNFSKNKMYNEIIEEIYSRNSNIMIGYTYENMDKYNNLYR